MAHSPHKRWKGCMMCKPNKIGGQGRSRRDPWPVLKKMGKKRRLRRGDLGDSTE